MFKNLHYLWANPVPPTILTTISVTIKVYFEIDWYTAIYNEIWNLFPRPLKAQMKYDRHLADLSRQ